MKRRRLNVLAITVLTLALGSETALALVIGDAFSGGQRSGNFYSVNLGSGAVTQIGGANVLGLQGLGLPGGENFVGLEFASNGTLYGLTSRRLLTIDPNTGLSQTVGSHGLGRTSGTGDLAFDANGVLYGVQNAEVFTLNLNNGLANRLGRPTLPVQSPLMSGLTFDTNGRLFVTESLGFRDALYELNPALIGRIGGTAAAGADVRSA